MPFTPSHAVVALPFIRTPLPAVAVAVGAMTPDLPLFVRAFPEDYGKTHSFAWLPVTVVVALALLLLWRGILRPATPELSPTWLASRLPGEWSLASRDSSGGMARTGDVRGAGGIRSLFALRGRTAPSWAATLLLVAALVIGVASHIVWDSFTHEGRWGMTELGLAQMWGPLPAYKWLQYGSGIGGLIVLAIWGALRLKRAPVERVVRVLPAWVRWAWWIALPVLLGAAWAIGYAHWGPFTADFTPQHLGYRVLPRASAVWVGAGILLALAVPVVRRARRGLSAPRRS